METPRYAFLSGWDAIFLLVGLHFTEGVLGAVFDDFGARWGWSDDARSAATLLLASAIVFTLAMRFTRTGWRTLFHASRASPGATAALVVPPVLALVPLLVLAVTDLTEWILAMAPLSRWEEELFAAMTGDTLLALLLVCVFAPVLEEMLFRGLILRGFLAHYPRWPAIVASAVLFGASHLNIYQFAVGVLLGLPLGWLYARTRSLIPCIALHAAYNACITWMDTREPAGADADPAWWTGTPWAWALAFVLAAGGLVALTRLLQPRPA